MDAQDFAMGWLSRWVQCNYKAPHLRVAGGQEERRCDGTGFANGGKGPQAKECRGPLEAGTAEETVFSEASRRKAVLPPIP